jgi:hypothetical protein
MNLKIIMNKYKVTLLMIDPSNGDETLKSLIKPMMSVMLLKSRKNARK